MATNAAKDPRRTAATAPLVVRPPPLAVAEVVPGVVVAPPVVGATVTAVNRAPSADSW